MSTNLLFTKTVHFFIGTFKERLVSLRKERSYSATNLKLSSSRDTLLYKNEKYYLYKNMD